MLKTTDLGVMQLVLFLSAAVFVSAPFVLNAWGKVTLSLRQRKRTQFIVGKYLPLQTTADEVECGRRNC